MKRGRPSGRPRFAALALLAASAGLITAGCGGDGDSADADAKAEFIASADQICTEAGNRIDAQAEKRQRRYGEDLATGDYVAKLYSEVTIPELQRMFDQIAELTPPPGSEQQVDEIIDAANAALSEGEKNPKILAKTAGQGNPFDEVNALEQEFGFQVCGAAG